MGNTPPSSENPQHPHHDEDPEVPRPTSSGKHNHRQNGDDPEVLRIRAMSFENFNNEVCDIFNKLNKRSSENTQLYKNVFEVTDTLKILDKLQQNFTDIQNCSSDLLKKLTIRIDYGRDDELEALNNLISGITKTADNSLHDESVFSSILKRKALELVGNTPDHHDKPDYLHLDVANPAKALDEWRVMEGSRKQLEDGIIDTLQFYLDVKAMCTDEPGLTALEENLRTAGIGLN